MRADKIIQLLKIFKVDKIMYAFKYCKTGFEMCTNDRHKIAKIIHFYWNIKQMKKTFNKNALKMWLRYRNEIMGNIWWKRLKFM